MDRMLAMVLAGVIVGAAAGCGGGEGDIRSTPPATPTQQVTPSQKYGGVARRWVGDGCSDGAVVAITTNYISESLAEASALNLCESAGAACDISSFDGCVAVAAGIEAQADASGTRSCSVMTRGANSIGVARSSALQGCRSYLGPAAQCDVVNSGCASYSTSPGIRTWSPPQSPTQPSFDTQSLRNVNITIPSSCPRGVEVCVRDHQCEDGDQVQVSVNNSVIFSGELFNSWECQRVPVQAGNNSVQLLAINGTGYKGDCDHSDANTGEVRIRGGSSSNTQTWRHAGGTGSAAWLNVNIGSAGGSCTPGTTPDASNRPPEFAGGFTGGILLYLGTPLTRDLSCRDRWVCFSDPDGDNLRYTATSSDSRVVTVSVSGSKISLIPVGVGVADVMMTAHDPYGATGSHTLRFTVRGGSDDDDDPIVPPGQDCSSAWRGDPGDFAQVGVQCAAACSAINAGRPDSEVAAYCGILSRWARIGGYSRDDVCPVCRGR